MVVFDGTVLGFDSLGRLTDIVSVKKLTTEICEMQLLKYEAHNVLGVKDIKFDLQGRHIFLVGGGNGQGKTSALTALIMAVCGKSGMKDYPEISLRKGQKKGKVTVTLSGDDELMESDSITVELSLRRKPSGVVVEEFRVLDSAGEEAPEPRTLLKRLFHLRAFDPLEFERMKPKEQATVVQEMLGLDLGKYDAEYKQVFEERTVLGREGKKLAAQLEAAPKHKDAPKEEVKVAELMEELDSLDHQAKDRGEKKHLLEVATEERDELDEDIAKLQEALKKAMAQRDAKDELIVELKEQFEATEDVTDKMSAIRERIAQADEMNRKVRENAEHARLSKVVKESRASYQKMSDRLKEIAEERAEEVANAKWPVEGMELQEDGLLMNGLPFEQASTSQRIMASVKVGMALNPKLRLLVCEHGSDLDGDTLDTLEAVLKEHDFQMIVELVTRTDADEDRCAVVIADGRVVKEDGEEVVPDEDEEDDEDDN